MVSANKKVLEGKKKNLTNLIKSFKPMTLKVNKISINEILKGEIEKENFDKK